MKILQILIYNVVICKYRLSHLGGKELYTRLPNLKDAYNYSEYSQTGRAPTQKIVALPSLSYTIALSRGLGYLELFLQKL